eukprot:969350-Prorocentrum_minimum.AAC.1
MVETAAAAAMRAEEVRLRAPRAHEVLVKPLCHWIIRSRGGPEGVGAAEYMRGPEGVQRGSRGGPEAV